MHNRRLGALPSYLLITLFFITCLGLPLITLLATSFQEQRGLGLANYAAVFADPTFMTAVRNSVVVSTVAALITTIFAFILAYTVNCTRIPGSIKSFIKVGIAVPMLLPTITYGFAIMYSFGKQGLLTKLFGQELLSIYGFNGLLIGYVMYTLPTAFLLINNSFTYVDKRFVIVSVLLGDGFCRSFINSILRPLVGTLGGAFVLAFILSFTDFGIPASIGGGYHVVSTQLYQVMLGAIPDFNSGSAIAMVMLIPAVFGVLFLNYLEQFNFHYDKITPAEILKNTIRDTSLAFFSIAAVSVVLAIFLVMFICPFVKEYPYDMTFTTQFFRETLFTSTIWDTFENSILIALATAVLGTILSYCAALLNVRANMTRAVKLSLDSYSMITNTVPGMVLGLAYLLFFNDSSWKGTFAILIVCNIVHFFATPYLMAQNCLSKMNPAWETTAELLGDTWLKTVMRVIIPNSLSTIVEMFSYYFINAMVTISAIIFLVTASTSVVTSKIKELQHFANFNEIFVLSILIFLSNIVVKMSCETFSKKSSIKR